MVIGNEWASCTGQDGRRRLDDPNDWALIEVLAALRRNVLLVPVLVEGARLSEPASMPEELRPFACLPVRIFLWREAFARLFGIVAQASPFRRRGRPNAGGQPLGTPPGVGRAEAPPVSFQMEDP